MEDIRGTRRGSCTNCGCDGYILGDGGKCKNCKHHPGRHVKDVLPPKAVAHHYHGSYASTSSYSKSHAGYTPTDYSSYQYVTHTPTIKSMEWTTTPEEYRTHALRCKCSVPSCARDAFYDVELREQFKYCSGDCRDRELLEQNVRDTKKDIENMEQSVKRFGDLHLPKVKSGTKINCHKCDNSSLGSRIYAGVVNAVKTEKYTKPEPTSSSTYQTKYDVSKKAKERGTESRRAAQSTVMLKVDKRGKEELGLFFSNSHLPDLHGCTITGYKCDSPIGPQVYKGEIHLLDVVVKVNGVDFKDYRDFDRLSQSYHVDLLCNIQSGHHVSSLCGLDVPAGVTHVFALRCSQMKHSIGIEVSPYYRRVTEVDNRSVAEESGIKKMDIINMFTVMPSPEHMKQSEKYTDYTTDMFLQKIKEAFKKVSSSLSTILLFIQRS